MKFASEILSPGAMILFFLTLPQSSMAQPYWTIGPKIGYTFGPGGGFTGGAELSYFPYHTPGGFSYTLDLNAWSRRTSVHIGAQFASIVGIDVGPTIFIDSTGLHPGISITPWLGAILYPYFELDIPFGESYYTSVGAYAKLLLAGSFNLFN